MAKRKPGDGVSKSVEEALAPEVEAKGEVDVMKVIEMGGAFDESELPQVVEMAMGQGIVEPAKLRELLEQNLKNREALDSKESKVEAPAETKEVVGGQIAQAKAELETANGQVVEMKVEMTPGPKTLEELLKAMEGEGGADYDNFDYAETPFARKELHDLIETIKTLKAKNGNEVALDYALTDYRLTDNTTFDDRVRDKAIELFKKEYGVAETETELLGRQRKTKIEEEIKQAYQRGGFSHTRYTTYEDFGDYNEALERAEKWLETNQHEIEAFAEKAPGAWATFWSRGKAEKDYQAKLKEHEDRKKRVPDIEKVIAAIREIKERYEN